MIAFVLLTIANTMMATLFRSLEQSIIDAINRWWYPDVTAEVEAYLAASFDQPIAMLSRMARANALLTGARALGFDVPGSVTQNAAWEFCTYHSPHCVGLTMQALAAAGVQWCDVFEPLRTLLHAPPGSVFTVEEGHLRALVRRAFDDDQLPALGADLERILTSARSLLLGEEGSAVIHLNNGAYLRVNPSSEIGSATNTEILSTVIGYTTHADSSDKVTLTFRKGVTPIQHVLSYHSSLVQCFISPFAAAHFDYAEAKKGEGRCWPFNRQGNLELNDPIIFSWNFRLRSTRATLSAEVKDFRLRTGKASRFRPLLVPTGLPGALHRARADAFKNIRWQTSEGETRFVPTEPRSLLATLRAFREVTSRRRDEWVAGSGELAARHTVGFDEGGVYPTADELPGV